MSQYKVWSMRDLLSEDLNTVEFNRPYGAGLAQKIWAERGFNFKFSAKNLVNFSKKFIAAISATNLVVSLMLPAIIFAPFANAADSLFSDGFENTPQFTNPAWDQIDPQWQTVSSQHKTGSKAAQVSGNTVSPNHPEDDVLRKNFSTAGYENIIFSYWFKAQNLESADDDKVEVQWTSDGSSWTTLFTINDNVDTNQWISKSHTLAVSAENNADFGIRFKAKLDNGNDKVWLDDVSVSGVVIVNPEENPELSNSCGLDIALVMDSSGSINDPDGDGPLPDELVQMKSAFHDFVDAFLPATPTQFSVTEFDNTAYTPLDFTDNVTDIKNKIDGASSGGATNWEDGLLKAQGTFDPRPDHPNLVIFASDGNPNRKGANVTVSEAEAVNAAVVVANSLKDSGTKIIALGIGNDLDTANLEAISSPSDVYTSDFETLAEDLATLAEELCGGTITVKKLIDNDGSLDTEDDRVPALDWTFTIDPGSDYFTDESGQTQAVEVDQGTYSILESVQEGYELLSASCEGATSNGSLDGNAILGIEVSSSDIVSCVFINHANHKPLITLSGDDPVNLTVGTPYVEPGFSASDIEDGDITANVVVTDLPNTDTIGSYTVRYNVSDSDSLAADEKTRAVNVNAPPAQCSDTNDNDGDGFADYPNDPSCSGPEDDSENTPPVITIDTELVMLTLHSSFDPLAGVTVTDEEDEPDPSAVVGGDPVDTDNIGDYIVTYNATDSDGASAVQKTKTVKVRAECGDEIDNDGDGDVDDEDEGCEDESDNDENSAPEIELIGLNLVSLLVGDTYNEDGATAHDNEDGDNPADVGGDAVDTGTPGTYIVTYNYTDTGGLLASEVTRTVTVNARPECSDGDDNDEDDLTDSDDPACHTDGNAENSESYDPDLNDESNDPEPTPQCSDGIDNDGDEVKDFGTGEGNDLGCSSPEDNNESDNPSATGHKWNDLDGDGNWDDDEPGIEGWAMALGLMGDAPIFSEEGPGTIPIEIVALSLTGTGGNYSLPIPSPGHYVILEESRSGWQVTSPGSNSSIDSFFDITYRIDFIDPPQFEVDSFFDIFVEVNFQPEGSLNFGNHNTQVIDVCQNLEGTQSEVPEGMIVEEGQCVEESTPPTTPPSSPDLPECSDGIDNDGDGLVDIPNDPGCLASGDDDESGNPTNTGGGGGGGGGNGDPSIGNTFSGGSVLGASTGPATSGQVLGESTSCGEYLREYIKLGKKNTPEEVSKLQQFLNEHLGLNLPLTGFYGPLTLAAVGQFQTKYGDEVLAPWIPFGHPDKNTPTGYVYKTTKRWINNLACSTLNLPIPQLP